MVCYVNIYRERKYEDRCRFQTGTTVETTTVVTAAVVLVVSHMFFFVCWSIDAPAKTTVSMLFPGINHWLDLIGPIDRSNATPVVRESTARRRWGKKRAEEN